MNGAEVVIGIYLRPAYFAELFATIYIATSVDFGYISQFPAGRQM